MSEEQFTRSEIGHDANDLHNHGGLDAPEEKTEREDLENAIEALNDSEETEKLEKIENDIKGEPINEQVAAAARELEEAQEEPVNAWKNKAENQAYMAAAPAPVTTEPKAKKKGGAGWKLATVFFFLLAAAGCGATAYLFFNNGKTELMGRVVTSETKEKNESKAPKDEEVQSGAVVSDSDYIYLKSQGVKIKLPKDTTTPFEWDGKTLVLWSAQSDSPRQYVPSFADPESNTSGMAAVHIVPKEFSGGILYSAVGDATKIVELGDVAIYLESSNGGAPAGSEDEDEWYHESLNKLNAFLRKAENYEAIK